MGSGTKVFLQWQKGFQHFFDSRLVAPHEVSPVPVDVAAGQDPEQAAAGSYGMGSLLFKFSK